ncbi:hypothetical protein PO124_14665 [Bacillus licheniformis]|nr:hypothetical protein [Bacillus licheniformis]
MNKRILQSETGERDMYLTSNRRNAYFNGSMLEPGNLIVGPAIIEQWGTTIVVYPGHEALIDSYRNCVIEVKHAQQATRGGNA